MEKIRKEEILQEIEKEEKLCREIYEGILRNRVLYTEKLRKLQQANLSQAFNSVPSPSSSSSSHYPPKAKQTLRSLRVHSSSKPLSSPSHSNKENVFPLKNCILSPMAPKHFHNRAMNLNIPISSLQDSMNLEGLSSRKNPLDSLRNTTDREDLMLSIDSLQYSEDLSFL